MPEPFSAAGAEYLEQLLGAAIRAPAAGHDPASGRVVAKLIVALVAKGEDARLEPYLSCSPGRRAVFEVTCYDEDERPASWITDLGAGQAIRAAAKFATARPDGTITVVARDDSGAHRRVLVARGPVATYQFPETAAAEEVAPAEAEAAPGTGHAVGNAAPTRHPARERPSGRP